MKRFFLIFREVYLGMYSPREVSFLSSLHTHTHTHTHTHIYLTAFIILEFADRRCVFVYGRGSSVGACSYTMPYLARLRALWRGVAGRGVAWLEQDATLLDLTRARKKRGKNAAERNTLLYNFHRCP